MVEGPRPPQRFDDNLTIFVVGKDEPILTESKVKQITLGRLSPGESSPTVDLTPHEAVVLGVSRLHAVLHRSDNGCYIQDLNSTNGTFLNDRRLAPHKLVQIKSGDVIALGQLGLRVFFETAQTEYTIGLIDETLPGQRLTPAYLETGVSKYLLALANAQQLIDMMLNHPLTGMTIRSIEMQDDGLITVTLIGARDVIRLLETRFTEWRQARLIMVERLRALNQEAKAQMDAAARTAIKTKSDPLVKDVRTQLKAFAESWVSAAAPALDENKRRGYAEKFVPVLQSLLFSPLQPTASAEEAETASDDTIKTEAPPAAE